VVWPRWCARWPNPCFARLEELHPLFTTKTDWLSQRRRKRVEEVFGWLKTVALFRKTRHRGVARVGWLFVFATALYNLVRLRNLGVAVT